MIKIFKRTSLFFLAILITVVSNNTIATQEQVPPIIRAVQEGNVKTVKELIVAGADVNVSYQSHYTPLIRAIESGNKNIVEELLKAGADIEKKSLMILSNNNISRFKLVKIHLGFATPLSWAIRENQKEIAQMLVQAGAQVNVKPEDIKKRTFLPLSLALYDRDPYYIRMLLAAGADVSALNYYDRFALKLKLRFGLDINDVELKLILVFIILLKILLSFLCFWIFSNKKTAWSVFTFLLANLILAIGYFLGLAFLYFIFYFGVRRSVGPPLFYFILIFCVTMWGFILDLAAFTWLGIRQWKFVVLINIIFAIVSWYIIHNFVLL